MNYDEINVDEVVENVASAVEKGNNRNATKKETMQVRLAALSAIVRKMQSIVENDKELAGV
jgi:N-acetylglucosamine kinase-like BadF-type ATPase